MRPEPSVWKGPGFQSLLIIVLAMWSNNILAVDCDSGDLELTLQDELDNFQDDYGPCDRINASVTISGEEIENVAGLAAITEISGNLRFLQASSLDDLGGLSALEQVGGTLFFIDANSLTQVDGLASLASVGGHLWFSFNNVLSNLDGLAALTTAGGLVLEFNTSMTNIHGLSALEQVAGSVRLESNITLGTLDGFSSLVSVGGNFSLIGNTILGNCGAISPLLDSVDDADPGPGPGAAGIPDVGGSVTLQFNPPGCNNIDEITGGVFFENGFESPKNTVTTVEPNLGGGGISTLCPMRIGSDGFGVLAYHNNTQASLNVAKCTDTLCSGAHLVTNLVDDPEVAFMGGASIAVGADGFPFISYFQLLGIPTQIKVAKCNDLACSGGNEELTLLGSSGNNGSTSVAVGPDGLPTISYPSNGNLNVIKCNDADCVGADETITTVDNSPNNVGGYSSIAIGNDSFPVISYIDADNGVLLVAKCNDLACAGADESIEAINDFDASLNGPTSLAIGIDGFPVISYVDQTNGFLKVARCNDVACAGEDETVSVVDDSANAVGYGSSLAIGADGFPVISYWDSTADNLKIAKCNDPACSGGDEHITTADSGGRSTSIAIGTDGLPVISYCNSASNGFALKILHCGTPDCEP
jgi:hypothetical protein